MQMQDEIGVFSRRVTERDDDGQAVTLECGHRHVIACFRNIVFMPCKQCLIDDMDERDRERKERTQ